MQGKNNLAKYLEDNPDQYKEFEDTIFSMIEIER